MVCWRSDGCSAIKTEVFEVRRSAPGLAAALAYMYRDQVWPVRLIKFLIGLQPWRQNSTATAEWTKQRGHDSINSITLGMEMSLWSRILYLCNYWMDCHRRFTTEHSQVPLNLIYPTKTRPMLLNVDDGGVTHFALLLYYTSFDLSLIQKVILFNYMVGKQIAS